MINSNVIDLVKYQAISSLIKNTSCHVKLATLAANITRSVKANKERSAFLKLAAKATRKSNKQRILEKCPQPINDSLLEEIAFKTFIDAAAIANQAPNARVIHFQLKKLGYAKTFAKQVSNQVATDRFHKLRAKGLDKITAEYFVYHYAEHLVTPKVYAKVKALFQSKPRILFPSYAALAA